MKKLLLILFLAVYFHFAWGQITTPIVKANFGIEADLSCNFYNNAPLAAVDDWFGNGYPGTGQFIIDTTGAAAIVAGYFSNPATRTMPFSRLMRQAPYTVVNNRLLLDAIFQRDFHGDDSTVFASGSNKNGMTPATWTCPPSQSIPDKNDILDAMVHVRRAGPNATDSLWMFAGISIENTTGNRFFDFELYQTNLVYNRSTQTFSGYGPDAGHTTWKFDAAGNILTPGDIIFTAEFSSSSLTLVEARIWVNKASLSITPTTFSWGGDFDGDGSGAVYGYANILPKTVGSFYTGLQNSVATWAGPFQLVRDNNSVVTTYLQRQFMEFSVNLTKLGIEPASFSNNACGSPFRRVLVKTRASTSFTAELKDFIAPFNMFDFPLVDATSFIQYYCGTMPTTSLNVSNPLSTSIYTWSTTNGNIVGSTTGNSITIDAPGTYKVVQQLHTQCPSLAIDSLTILFDPVCTVLDVSIKGFNANRVGKEATLNWQVRNNEQASNYLVEYSYDNRTFHQLAGIQANSRTGTVDYSLSHQMNNNGVVTFYRVKVVGKNQGIQYSNTIQLKPAISDKTRPVIFPNPSNGEAWLAMESSETTIVNVFISDLSGRVVKTLKIPVNKGSALVPIHELTGRLSGMYFVKVKTPDGETTQKLLLK